MPGVTADLFRPPLSAVDRQLLVDLAKTYGVELHPLDDGEADEKFVYSPPDGRRDVLVMRMTFNWRIAEADYPGAWGLRHWCFEGTDVATFIRVVRQLAIWQGDPDSEPRGWIKAWDDRRHDQSS